MLDNNYKKIDTLMRYYRFIITGVMVMALLSCEDGALLTLKTDNYIGDEFTWELPQKAEGVLMNAYYAIPTFIDNYGSNFLDAATDNAVTNDFSSAVYQLGNGGMTSTSQQPLSNWSAAYEQINYINLFLENGLRDDLPYNIRPDISEQHKARLRGEAYFLRAWWHAELLRVYGGISDDGEALGVPIFTSSLPDHNITANLKRNTYEDTALQIFADCDSAFKYLPMAYNAPSGVLAATEVGRATKKTALALKSRIATYAASPAYQPEGSYAISDAEITAKWERAALFSHQAITEGALGAYSQLSQNLMVGSGLTTTPPEYIFRIFFNNRGMESRNLPPAFFGGGRTNPSQNLVDAFPAVNGYPINDSRSGYDPQNPYNNRDNRLSLTVYFNGMSVETGGRALEIYYDVQNQVPGIDAPGYFHNNTRTGYYLKKWMSMLPGILNVNSLQNDFHLHPLLRRAEVYLNYAEASNQAVGPTGIVPGCDRSAMDIINDIRQKSGGITITDYAVERASAGKEAFHELILNERRIELAFENHRYFDMRRWKKPLNESIRGVKIEKHGDGLVFFGTDTHGGPVRVEDRKLDNEKYYYTPLPYSELVVSPLMKNNKGW
jgi:starch-binding outer membrane protein, SusD/RagB family